MAKSGHNAKALLTGASVSMTEEACSVVAGTSNEVWEIDAASKDVFDVATTFTVEVSENSGADWDTLGTDEFALRYLIGRVDVADYDGTVANITDVRISGAYLPKYEQTETHSSGNDKTINLVDSSCYQHDGIRRTPIRQDFSASVDTYDMGNEPLDGSEGDEDSVLDRLLSGDAFVLEIAPDDNSTIRAWVKPASQSTDSPGDGLHDRGLSLEGAQQTPTMTSQTASLWDYRA